MKYYDLYQYPDGDLFIVNQGYTYRKWLTIDGDPIEATIPNRVEFTLEEGDEVFTSSSLIQRKVPEDRLLMLVEYL